MRPLAPLGPALALATVFGVPASLLAQATAAPPLQEVDALFADFQGEEVPGCAVGVEEQGARILTRAYGMANLEWGIPNSTGTIFENGSVSKQFTAAAVVLLALEGKLSLEDDVREYVPELPDYGHTVTLRHLLNHTSGLRDWGSVAGISGWGRSQRTHTHDHVLDILSRQSALNFEPGYQYSYSNSGYNLLAIIVSRVSGVPFAQFSKERIFGPLGMDHTRWRDDYTRIVPGRSVGYSPNGEGGYHIDHPIEDVHGNGGLLTTVDDLLTWNRSLDEASLAGSRFVEMMTTRGILNDGRTIDYALGLTVGEWRGVRTVEHGGATSGYRAYLARYPDQGLSVALLCNAGDANAGGLAQGVARLFLEDDFAPEPVLPEPAVAVEPAALERMAGMYRDARTGEPGMITLGNDGILRVGRTPLVPISATEFHLGTSGERVVWDPSAGGERTRVRRMVGEVVVAEMLPTQVVEPTAAELAEYVGSYHSDDAETTLRVAVEDGALVFHRRPADVIPSRAAYPDAFATPLGFIRFLRDGDGRITELTLMQGRVFDLRFQRMGG